MERMSRMRRAGPSLGDACPNLPQRSREAASAMGRDPEFQRLSSSGTAQSGPLWQIWTPSGRNGRPRERSDPASAVIRPPRHPLARPRRRVTTTRPQRRGAYHRTRCEAGPPVTACGGAPVWRASPHRRPHPSGAR